MIVKTRKINTYDNRLYVSQNQEERSNGKDYDSRSERRTQKEISLIVRTRKITTQEKALCQNQNELNNLAFLTHRTVISRQNQNERHKGRDNLFVKTSTKNKRKRLSGSQNQNVRHKERDYLLVKTRM